MEDNALPVGEAIPERGDSLRPERGVYEGRFVVLAPVDAHADADELYRCSHGSPAREALWTYMGYGPFADAAAMRGWLHEQSESSDPLFLTVGDRESKRRVGLVSFLNIVPDAWRLELGHIWYAPEVQRTHVNTETVYLMLCEAFERLRYRRVEWKCDSLNTRSRAAALRLGFEFEGVFRQHMVVKGRNRDTAWYSMLDAEWPGVKANVEHWLYDNPDRTLSLGDLHKSRG
jgi:RimJ/RimL family protein N-acetyltransferase